MFHWLLHLCIGAVAQAIIYPLDVIKTRLQCHGEPGKAPNLLKFTRDIFVHEGPRALYRGLTPSLLGIVPYAGIDLAVYESLKMMSQQYLPPNTGLCSLLVSHVLHAPILITSIHNHLALQVTIRDWGRE